MNTDGDLSSTPQPEPGDAIRAAGSTVGAAPAASWLRRNRLVLISAGGVLALGAVSAAAALVLMAKPATTIEKMVPATADVLVVANLDPSVSQKLNLLRALHSFPDTKTDKAISDRLDQAFKGSGLSYSGDVQPWVGAQLGLSGRLNLASSADSTFVLYALSKDDARAKAALAKFRTTDAAKKLRWHDETYDGATISVGTPSASTGQGSAYTIADHVVVIASSGALIHEVIDTERGRSARLVDSSDYQATFAGLPTDRVGFVYVNGHSMVTGIKKQLAKTSTVTTPLLRNVNDLDALQGIGATLSAGNDGVLADLLVKLDTNKLSRATREALAHAGHPDGVLKWIPKGSDAFLAVGNLNQTIKTALDAAGSDPSIAASTNAIGLTGPGGVLPHLTGDAGLEVEVGSGPIPAGAILLGTDDARSMSAFFRKVLSLATAASAGLSSASGSGSPAGPTATGRVTNSNGFTTTTYRGVVITSLQASGLSAFTFQPSYAVLDGMGILGSNVAEVKAVIDVHKGAAAIAADPTYQMASGASLAKPSGVIYINVGSLLSAARRLPLGGATSGVDDKALANVEPIKAFMLSAASQADRAIERIFLVIK